MSLTEHNGHRPRAGAHLAAPTPSASAFGPVLGNGGTDEAENGLGFAGAPVPESPRKPRRKRSILPNVVIALVFLLGLGVLLYPSASNLYNQWRQDQLAGDYEKAVDDLSEDELEAAREAARAYNAALSPTFSDAFTSADIPSDDEYWRLLDVAGNGVMGTIEIPKIQVRLPIYHGTGETELQNGIGHLYGTSLPVGGSGTHSVLSGHRGLPSALLFTDLDQLQAGDRFGLHVLGETLAYEVDQVLVVEPTDVSSLLPEEGSDYCTLVTCTPYGVNTQRLLVRGHRVDSMGDTAEVTTAGQVAQSLEWWHVVVLLCAILMAVMVIVTARNKAEDERRRERYGTKNFRRGSR